MFWINCLLVKPHVHDFVSLQAWGHHIKNWHSAWTPYVHSVSNKLTYSFARTSSKIQFVQVADQPTGQNPAWGKIGYSRLSSLLCFFEYFQWSSRPTGEGLILSLIYSIKKENCTAWVCPTKGHSKVLNNSFEAIPYPIVGHTSHITNFICLSLHFAGTVPC